MLQKMHLRASLHLFVLRQQTQSHYMDFFEIWYCGMLLKSDDTFQFLLKLDNNKTLCEELTAFFSA